MGAADLDDKETIASDLTYDLRSGDPDMVRPIKS
jgi:hypothetical protein